MTVAVLSNLSLRCFFLFFFFIILSLFMSSTFSVKKKSYKIQMLGQNKHKEQQ